MKRLNLNLDDKTIERLEFLQDWYVGNKTAIIKMAIAHLYREVWGESVSPSTVGQQVGPTVLGGQQHQEEN